MVRSLATIARRRRLVSPHDVTHRIHWYRPEPVSSRWRRYRISASRNSLSPRTGTQRAEPMQERTKATTAFGSRSVYPLAGGRRHQAPAIRSAPDLIDRDCSTVFYPRRCSERRSHCKTAIIRILSRSNCRGQLSGTRRCNFRSERIAAVAQPLRGRLKCDPAKPSYNAAINSERRFSSGTSLMMCSSARRSAICRTSQPHPTSASVRNRRLSSVAVGPGDGPLTERTAGLHAGVSGTGLHAPKRPRPS